MLRKFLAYEGARQQRLHTSRGWTNFRVLTITSSPERTDTMRALIARTATIKGSPLFLFADHAVLTQSNPLSHQWIDVAGKAHTLI
jgi:hypothetical protein